PRFAADRYGEVVAARFKRDDGWREQTFAELGTKVERLALGLIEAGIEPGDRVCILADTRPEWGEAAYAVWSAGAIVVPIYPTNSPEECEWVAGNSGAVAAICDDAAKVEKLVAVRDRLPDLRSIYVIDPEAAGEGVTALDEVATEDCDRDELARRIEAVGPEDPFLIIYTSGTTGPPKGCVLAHRNGIAICTIAEENGTLEPGDTAYLYLPLAHVFAQIMLLAGVRLGATAVYFGGNTREIIPEIQETKPQYLPSVPRIFEKLYGMAMAAIPPERQDDVREAVKLGVEVRSRRERGEDVPEEMLGPFEQADRELFAGVRAIFGGRMREAATGAAPIASEILEFFYAAGVPVMEGYGMTESTGLGAQNRPDAFRFGTVGRAMTGCEARIARDGEILMRGPHIFLGYWQNPEATDEVLVDGWLYTGDLGSIDEDGYLSITGRKKDIIITAGGKNLTPANLENDLTQNRFISRAVMYGDRRPYPVALITLDEEEIVPWAKQQGLPEALPELAGHEQVRGLVKEHLDRVNAKYAQVEQIKRFSILDHDLSQEEGELTPTLKLKRNVVYERYAARFDQLYA
ncbi:MAG TPA: AMP-binding protein, partial [Solirubrobacterales bacterium]